MQQYVLWYTQLGMQDAERVGGKNASLGEMISNLSGAGVSVPRGFATTAYAFNEFLESSGLNSKIYHLLDHLVVDDIVALNMAGRQIRDWVVEVPFQSALDQAIREAYDQLCTGLGNDVSLSFAVRSSVIAEEMPEASFAGQQETFLNVRGIDAVMVAIKHVFASLFNDRAIYYRVHQGYDHKGVAFSVGVQQMVRSDLAASGVMRTLDTESGFNDVVCITGTHGLGEMVVQGAVNPDEFYVHKPTLKAGRPALMRKALGSKLIKMTCSDDAAHGCQVQIVDADEAERSRFCITDAEVMALAKQALIIEQHYGRPMDIEWAKDGRDGKLYIVLARPDTVPSRHGLFCPQERGYQTNRRAISLG